MASRARIMPLRVDLTTGMNQNRADAINYVAAQAVAHPARRYVMIDDKLRILMAMKQIWGERLTTVFPRQGHYALDPAIVAQSPAADITLERIGELATVEVAILGADG